MDWEYRVSSPSGDVDPSTVFWLSKAQPGERVVLNVKSPAIGFDPLEPPSPTPSQAWPSTPF